jgi:hypothetical protein
MLRGDRQPLRSVAANIVSKSTAKCRANSENETLALAKLLSHLYPKLPVYAGVYKADQRR